jgi:hypothetical protein
MHSSGASKTTSGRPGPARRALRCTAPYLHHQADVPQQRVHAPHPCRIPLQRPHLRRRLGAGQHQQGAGAAAGRRAGERDATVTGGEPTRGGWLGSALWNGMKEPACASPQAKRARAATLQAAAAAAEQTR